MAWTLPLAVATPTSQPFWDGLEKGEVRLQQCQDCHQWVFYPRTHCPRCLSEALQWNCVDGRGSLHSFTLARVPTAPHFADQVPQILAIVELDEGVHLTSTLREVDPAQVSIGMRLRPCIEPNAEGLPLLRFVPDDPCSTQ
ncbi:MAG: OB-fold domain-containing protein [Pseudomonadales bacterium]|nr:OB-fold domain-containing protein [Pseudomonadales bacterium]